MGHAADHLHHDCFLHLRRHDLADLFVFVTAGALLRHVTFPPARVRAAANRSTSAPGPFSLPGLSSALPSAPSTFETSAERAALPFGPVARACPYRPNPAISASSSA